VCAKVKLIENYKKRGLFKQNHPELVAQLHPVKNAHTDLEKVTGGSNKSAQWVCHDARPLLADALIPMSGLPL
jgi:hypothetical protein